MNGCEGFVPQTLQRQKTKSQSNKDRNERLKGFSGGKNAYRKRLFQAVSASAGRAGKSPKLILLRKIYAEILLVKKITSYLCCVIFTRHHYGREKKSGRGTELLL